MVLSDRNSMRLLGASKAEYRFGHFIVPSERPIRRSPRGLCVGRGLLALVTLCFVASTKAATINVPSGQPTIQAGINAANTGDTVLVAPGTYQENIDFKGKAITVTSSEGASVTTIEGSGADAPVVNFTTGEQRNSILSGFTIQNGGIQTGAIVVGGASPTIMDNIITGNPCHAIYVNPGAALIEGNTISNTQAGSEFCSTNGTAILLGGSGTAYISIIIGNIIENNQQGGLSGGAIGINGAEGTIIESNIIRNNVSGQGAVTMSNAYSLIFVQNVVYGNQINGFLLSISSGAAGLTIGIPYGASSSSYGIVANNSFFDDRVVYDLASEEYVTSEVSLDGDISHYLFANNIVYGQQTLTAVACTALYTYLATTPLVVDHNDVFNPLGPAYLGDCSAVTGSNGNISADPLFNNSGAGDFQLQSGSPAIGTGDIAVIADLAAHGVTLSADINGNPRTRSGAIDMGPYENAPIPDFSVAASPTSLNVAPGQSGTVTVSVAPVNSFNSSVSFSCSGLPAGTTCSFSPATVTPSGTAASTTLTLTASTSASNHSPTPFRYLPVTALALSLCLLRCKSRRLYLTRLLCVVAVLSLTCITACGGGSGSSNSTGGGTTSTPESGTVTVTATSGSLSHSTSISVVVN